MATIEVALTITQARKVLQALSGPSVTDPVLADVHDDLAKWISVFDAQRAKLPPWRKVERREHWPHDCDILECGHKHLLRTTKNWREDHAQKRRCAQCAA